MSEAGALIRTLQSSGIRLSINQEILKVDAPKRVLSEEIKSQIKTHKSDIIEYLKILVMRDFCGVCKSRLYEERNQWHCPKNCRRNI
jgi:hypothetical protein